jgi:superfamily II DNA or RNA helicase
MDLALAVVNEVMSKHPTYKTHDQILNHILNRIGHDDELTALLNDAIKLRLLSVNGRETEYLPISQDHISTSVNVNQEHISNINIEPFNIRFIKEFEARPYQQEYINQCSKLFMEDGHERCLMKAPTGSGKNYMVMSIINKLLTVEKPVKSVLIVCLSPRIDITNQITRPEYLAILKLFQFTPLVMHSDVSYSKSCEEYNKARHENKNIIISGTYQSITKIMDMINMKQNTDIDFLIMDEAHYLVNQNVENTEKNTNLQNTTFLSTQVKRRLFVTATPYENQETNEAIYGPVVNIVSVGQLIRLGHLARLESSMCRISDNTTNIASTAEFTDKAKGLHEFMTTNKRYKCIVFVNSRENGYNLQKLIMDRGYKDFKVVTYFGEDSSQVLEDFQTYKEPIVIITCKRINMGVDVPDVDSIVFADPRLSKWDISQCIGRGLRKVEDKVCHCLLYDNEDHNQMIMNYLNYVANACEYQIVSKDIDKATSKTKQVKNPKSARNLALYNGVIDVRLELITEFKRNKQTENQEDINSECLENQNYKCAKCNKSYKYICSLKQHIQAQHTVTIDSQRH